ncbi:hypothetical protein H261_13940 [Paramagnetospirillum caucaseum]|uniref:Glycosyltransferase RgtA/B/C/D-like domain-containing protein n=1 Tax=Paramagnetospirillum caucaseum TaxID=1244869 RepID=M2ZPU3_9PROT|nr:hypothetical protein [Paramagnetospirillum caucaseum]EME69322.1 hypothetical protein H261_13940 [Paramagnetospirillum caucaseum]
MNSMIGHGKSPYLMLGAGLWAAWVLLVSWYYPVGGDEPGYYYSAQQIALGRWPVLDFLILQAPGFYLPYALISKFLSPSLEAARLISVACVILLACMSGSLAARAWGRAWGALAFVMVGLSHFMFYWNVQVIHFPLANMTALAAVWCILSRRPSLAVALTAGFITGWMADTRLVLGPVGGVILYLALRQGKAVYGGWGPAAKRIVAPFILAGIVAGLPLLVLLVADFQATLFNLVGARAQAEVVNRWQADTALQVVLNFLSIRWETLTSFLVRADGSPKASFGNCIVFVPPVLAVILVAKQRRLRAWWAEVKVDSVVSASAWMVAGILGIHFVTVVSGGSYIQSIFPFLVLISVGALAHATRGSPCPRPAKVVLALVLAAYGLHFFFFTFSALLRRNEPSDGRPVTAARVACWLERYTDPGELLMNTGVLPVAMAVRRLPVGFEYNNGIAWMFWRLHLDEAVARRYHIFRGEDFEALMESGEIRVLVDDAHLDTELVDAPRVRPLIAQNYRTLWSTGGPWAYEVKLLKSAWRDDLPVVRPVAAGEVTRAKLARKGQAEVVRATVMDFGNSLRALPADLGDTWARLTHAPYERRCASTLRDMTGP